MSAVLFVFLAAFRVINALLIQTQFDPDEYWQSLEVAYCHVFQEHHDCFQTLTWEWTRRAASRHWMVKSLHGPVRSHISIIPTYLWYQAIKFFGVDTSFAVSKGPMLVHAVLVAAVTDYSVWYLGSTTISKQTGRWSLFCSLTSWFHAYALVRTYSNSIETVLLMLGMVLMKQKRENLAYFLGGLSAANRFTSLAAWVPLGILSALHHHKSSSWKSRLVYLFYPCATYGLLGFGLSLIVDRYFYGFWTVPVLGNFHFNVLQGMGSLYGTHPWYWYLLAGLPVISGLLLPALVWGFIKHYNRPMWSIVGTYLLLHSVSAHKEFRFIMPILPLLCIMGGDTLAEELSGKKRQSLRILVVAVFVAANLIAFVYLGLIHQLAPLELNKAIVEHISKYDSADSTSRSTRISSKISIHYLMGCHSTPLYSHLHHTKPGVTVDTWHLDCSPSCRRRCHAMEECVLPCESDAFQNDPVAFVKDAYAICTPPPAVEPHSAQHDRSDVGNTTVLNEPTCEFHNVPTFIAIYGSDAEKVESQLQSMGLYEMDRFFHSIRGARIFFWNVGTSTLAASTSWSPTTWLDIHANEIILFRRPQH